MHPFERSGLRALGTGLLLFAAYVVVGKLGLRLAFAFPNATPVWPGAGLALAALLLYGYRVWPAIFAGALVVNLTTAGTLATSLGIAAGNTLEGIFGAWLLLRFAGGSGFLTRAEGIFKFTLLAALVSTTVSATIGTVTLHFAGLVPGGDLGSIWMTWWLGDGAGDLLVAPVLVSWIGNPPGPFRWDRGLEWWALMIGLLLVSFILFGGYPALGIRTEPLKFLTIPFLTWAAVRFGPREASSAMLLLGLVAVWGTLHHTPPDQPARVNATLLLLQTYMAVAAVMTLMLAATVTERKAAEARLHELSITDPLTGIANYRQLSMRMEAEVERSERTGRPFAVIFMDVDGLKKINDGHGHIVGSRALVRVAEVLRDSARVVDTAARYGGDEFALLLPETDEAEAARVAQRLRERLTAATETPPVQVSLGIAEYPRDGATADALLGAADRQLYQRRARDRGEPLAAPLAPPHTS